MTWTRSDRKALIVWIRIFISSYNDGVGCPRLPPFSTRKVYHDDFLTVTEYKRTKVNVRLVHTGRSPTYLY